MDARSYHLQELEIARNPDDARRTMPPVFATQARILDVGCGAGQTLLASHLAEGTTTVGVDPDRSALMLGRQLGENIRFICARGEALPVKSDYFDLVISRVAVPYMHVSRALAEMGRVLKGGGSLWIVLHPFSKTLQELREDVSRLELKRAIYRLYVLANGTMFHLSGREWHSPFHQRSYESFQTARGITRALTRAGFEDVTIDQARRFVVTAKKRRDDVASVTGIPAG